MFADRVSLSVVIAIGLISLFGQVPRAFAGIENRPLNSDEATVLDKGQWVIATGLTFVRQPNNDNEWAWATDLEYGIFDWLEINLDIPYQVTDVHGGTDLNGLGDVIVSLEWNPVRERDRYPAISFAANLKNQNANEDRGLGSGELDYTATILASKNFGSTSVLVNVGMTLIGDPPGTDFSNTVNYSAALAYEFKDNVTYVGELVAQTNADRSAETDPLELLVGAIYRVRDGVFMDGGIGTGLSPASPDLRVVSGITVEF